MTLLANTAESGQPDGTLVDGTNSATGGNAFTHVSNAAEITYQSGAAQKGVRGYRQVATTTAAYIGWTGVSGATTDSAVRMYFRFSALPTGTVRLFSVRSTGGGTGLVNIQLDSAAKVVLGSDPVAANLGTSAAALSVNTWYRCEVGLSNPSTTTGVATVRVYLGDTNTIAASLDLSGVNLGAAVAMGTVRFGRNNGGAAWAFDFDDVAFQTGSAALIGASSANFAPTVNAGSDQTVEPWATVTLTGTDSDPDGTITTRSWTQTGGPAVTLTGYGSSGTFEAPATVAGAALTFQYAVTDDAGATSTDTMTVAVLPAAERIMLGGSWVPARLRLVDAPAPPPGGGDPGSGPGHGGSRPRIGHDWSMWSRDPNYVLDRSLPIISAQMVLRHMGISRAVITIPYSEAAYASLQPSRGVVLYRDGVQQFSGLVGPLELDWDAETGRVVIKAECVGDEQQLADRLVFPDPLRAADDQTVNDYWTYTGSASTAMRQLISDQAGPTCRTDRQIPGLVLGADPGVGLSRTWSGLFDAAGPNGVLSALAAMSVVSGENLGLRAVTSPGALTFDIIRPRDLTAAAKFSVEFGNVAGITYRLEPPAATHALVAGQGDLHLRLRKLVVTASSLALSWGRQVWRYIDRRDTADVAELTKAAQDALDEGDGTVSLACTLLDSQAATYGVDWGLGDRITVYVRVPGQTGAVAEVADVVREISIEVDDKGAERIRPAIGSYDAKAVIPTPTQQVLARVTDSLSGLIARQ